MRKFFYTKHALTAILAIYLCGNADASSSVQPELKLPNPNYLAASGLPRDLTLEEYRYILSGETTAAQREANKKNVLDFRKAKGVAGNKDLTLEAFLQNRGGGNKKTVAGIVDKDVIPGKKAIAGPQKAVEKKIEALERKPMKALEEVAVERSNVKAEEKIAEDVGYEESAAYNKRKIGKDTELVKPQRAEEVRVEIEDLDEKGQPIKGAATQKGNKKFEKVEAVESNVKAEEKTLEDVGYEESRDKRKAAKRKIGEDTQLVKPKKAEELRIEIENLDEKGQPMQVGTPRSGKKDLNLD